MSMHLIKELERLRKLILSLGALAEGSVCQAVRALEKRDAALAQKVYEADLDIDRMEIEVEEECLKVLALHQPVAVDLRFIVSVSKINNDLERIGDQAVNIAHKAEQLAPDAQMPVAVDFRKMSATVRRMLKDSLDALVNLDSDLAQTVRATDDEVDDMKRDVRAKVMDALKQTPEQAEKLFAVYGAARNLERIADLAVNIGEDVIYMVEGEIVRHQAEESTR